MLQFIVSTLLLLCLPVIAFAAQPTSPAIRHSEIKRVIYITLDGVRWQDVFKTHSYLPIFWGKYAKNAEIYGEPGSNRTMEAASVPISLPSYQSQMTGVVTQCPHK